MKRTLLKLTFTFFLMLALGFSSGLYAGEHGSFYGVQPDLQVSYYPNPCKNMLQLDVKVADPSGQISIRFINLIGKEMELKFSLPLNNNSAHFELDLRSLPAGVYFMEVSNGSNSPAAAKCTRRITRI